MWNHFTVVKLVCTGATTVQAQSAVIGGSKSHDSHLILPYKDGMGDWKEAN